MNSDRGQALIETMLLGLVMMAPLLWGLGILAELHRSALATSSAAREASFEAARSIDHRSARLHADRSISVALTDHGLDPSAATVEWSVGTLQRGAPVEVVIGYPTRVLQAPFLGSLGGPSIWIHAKATARIDPYRSRS